MESIDKSLVPFFPDDVKDLPELVRLPILLSDPDKRGWFLAESEKQGLGAAIAYPDVISAITECVDFKGQEFFSAEEKSRKLITLPAHVFVKRDDMNRLAGLF